MKEVLYRLATRLVYHWKTTTLGSVVILFVLGHIAVAGGDAALHGTLITVGAGLLFAKDPQNPTTLSALLLAGYIAVAAAASGCTPSLEACRLNHPCPADVVVYKTDTLIQFTGPDATLNIPAPEITVDRPVYVLDTIIITKDGPVRYIYTETERTRDIRVDCPDTSATVRRVETVVTPKGYASTPYPWQRTLAIAGSVAAGLVIVFAGVKVVLKFI